MIGTWAIEKDSIAHEIGLFWAIGGAESVFAADFAANRHLITARIWWSGLFRHAGLNAPGCRVPHLEPVKKFPMPGNQMLECED